ncbi:hypothetical protein [Radiobacillus sp. PE A8.2]|uniref:hypothetical protein n=1 Tax=Radiobacillus sp. PE A8.2 TaxID=3380349 RepID=UPI00388F67FB
MIIENTFIDHVSFYASHATVTTNINRLPVTTREMQYLVDYMMKLFLYLWF